MNNPFPDYTPWPGGAEYRSVTLETLEGLKEAERLKEEGWAVGASSPFSITFWRPRPPDEELVAMEALLRAHPQWGRRPISIFEALKSGKVPHELKDRYKRIVRSKYPNASWVAALP